MGRYREAEASVLHARHCAACGTALQIGAYCLHLQGYGASCPKCGALYRIIDAGGPRPISVDPLSGRIHFDPIPSDA
jgi:hypothetical protein